MQSRWKTNDFTLHRILRLDHLLHRRDSHRNMGRHPMTRGDRLTGNKQHDKIRDREETIKYLDGLLRDEAVSDVEIRRTKRGFIILQVTRRVMTGESS